MYTMGMALTLPTIGFNRAARTRLHTRPPILVQSGAILHQRGGQERGHREWRGEGDPSGRRLRDRRAQARGEHAFAGATDLRSDRRATLRRGVEEARQAADDTFGCLMWYSFAVHEAPKYKAEAFNPDIHECQWLGMQPDPDPIHIARECLYQKLEKFHRWRTTRLPSAAIAWSIPPLLRRANTSCTTSSSARGQRAYREGVAGDQEALRRRTHRHLEDYAPNMSWDNVIGVDTNCAYDAPDAQPRHQRNHVGRRPIPVPDRRERPTPSWPTTALRSRTCTPRWVVHVGSNAGSTEAYNCYRIIAKDLGSQAVGGARERRAGFARRATQDRQEAGPDYGTLMTTVTSPNARTARAQTWRKPTM